MTDVTPLDFDPFAGPAILATAPSTEPQREIWTACALGDDASLAFNESITVKLAGPLDKVALSAALSSLVARHEGLRTTLSGDGLTLFIGAAFVPPLAELDLSGLSVEAADAQLRELATSQVSEPFDLGKGPLFRAQLLLLPEGQHALVFTAHHIVVDGWSTAVLVRDWAALYNALVSRVEATLPPAESLAAYARERAGAVSPARASNEEYWLKQFAGEVPILELPGDRPRPERKTYNASREDDVLDAELVGRVRKAGAKARASLFATLLSAFNVLMFRLSGQSDLVVGVPVAGQASEGHADLVGHCVNMLPLRSSLSATEPFSALLGRVRKTLLDAQDHQDFTFGTLLTKLPIARDPSRLPLVSVIFNLDRGMSSEAIGFQGLSAALKGNPRTYENFELFLNAVEIDGRIELEAQYNTDLFDALTVRRWLAGYRQLLESIASASETELGALTLTTADELTQIAAWNATDTTFDRSACVPDLVAAVVSRDPNKVALEFGSERLTYAELETQANRLAQALRARGVKRGALVGLCLERGVDLVVSLLAIHKAGGAYVPLDPGYPKDRLAFMVEDAGMQVLVTDSALQRELAFGVAQTVCVDAERAELSAQPAEPLPRDADSASPESPAYVIYTSGSTGKPKGVLVPHRAVVNLLGSVSRRPGLTPEDVVLAITTLSFDIAVSEVWLPLVVGAKMVMVSREVAADGVLLKKVCEERQVTFIDATPATYRLLLAAGFQGGPQLKLICTGEAMPKDLALALPPLAGSVWNGYGPTETTVWSTFWQVLPQARRVLIGSPVENTRIHILDARMQQTPIGVSGEIYIAGDGVTLGYLNRPDLTRDRFVPDPFDRSGALMYRTGDLGRYLNGGDIECLGRNDNQVKLRGFRIELGEIEDALTRHEALTEAAVILREDRPGDARLVGYVVSRTEDTPPSAELRQFLQRSLPDYMVPTTYVSLPRMPLTPSGKVDRRALPAPEGNQATVAADFVAPRSPTEKILAELWASALNVARVSVHDDFFALGGHSLLASQILARLRRDHGVELSFRRFFEAPSVARLAELIDGAPIAERSTVVGIAPRPAGVDAPLSLAQERLWLLEEMHPAQRVVHNLPAAWRLKGRVQLELLQESLDRIAARHEMLRMSLKVDAGRAVQRITSSVPLPIAFVDLRSEAREEREARMFAHIRQITAEPFDLTQAPLFRSTLFQLADEEFLYFTLRHNVIWDGWSFDVFLNELCLIYSALERGEEPVLPELPVSYGDYALWQREWVKGPALARQIAFWQDRLGGPVTDLALPLDRPRPAQTEHAGANTALAISRADADALTVVAHRAGTTLFNLLYAAYTVVLHRFSGQTEIVVGTPVRARNLPEVENLIGPFINAIVLRSTLDPRESFTAYLKRVRDMTLDSFSHQDMPLELLGTRPPIVRAFFSFQDAKSRPSSLGSASVSQVDVEPPAAANDIMLWLMDRPSELLAVANFSTEVFERETVLRLLRSFVTLLRDVVQSPERAVGELALLAVEDRAELGARVRKQGDFTPRPAYAELLARCTDASETLAFVAGGERTTCADLWLRARELASGLSGRVEPARAVAVALPVGVSLCESALGVWLAGGTVVTVDPATPEPYRLALLRGAAPSLVIAEESSRVSLAAAGHDVVTPAELSRTVSEEPRGAEPHRPAWLRVSFDDMAVPTQALTTHAELAARVRSLAELVGEGHGSFVAWTSAGDESLPFVLLLGAALKVPTFLATDEESLAAQIARAAELGAPCVLAPAEVWESLLASGERAFASASAVVAGTPSAELLSDLGKRVSRTLVLRSSPAPHAVPFACVLGEADASLLGAALGTAQVEVLDSTHGAVPIGAVGSLMLDTEPPTALGMHGRRRSDGRIESSQAEPSTLVIEGVPFSPAYVAGMLVTHPAVKQAHVRLATAPGAARLVAYFVAQTGAEFTDTELRRHLRGLLPESLVPRSFVELPSLPRAADGSVLISELPSPFESSTANDFVAPRNDAEQLLAELYAEALGLARVSVYDNFFDLGGHSLLCFRVIDRIEARTGKRVSPRAILLGSLEQVAVELGEDDGLRSRPPTAPPTPAARPPEQTDKSISGRVFQRLSSLLRR